MKWNAKHTKPEIIAGTTRLERRFAWLPFYIDGLILWFTTYEVLQVYRITEEKVIIDGQPVIFSPGKWINLANRCKQ